MAYHAWTMSKGPSLNEYLRRRGFGPKRSSEFMFVLKGRLGHIDRDLSTSAGTRSPGAWAYHLNTCALALTAFSSAKERYGEVDKTAIFLGVSPDAIVQRMRQLTAKIVEASTQYRKAGIDPQVHVTVNPYLSRAKQAALRWKVVNRIGSEPTRPDSPGGQTGGLDPSGPSKGAAGPCV